MTQETTPTIDEQLLNQGLDDTDKGEPAKVEAKDDDVLELGGEDAPELTDEQKAEAAEKGGKRSRSWQHRVDTLTARLREAERRASVSEAGGGRAEVEAPKAPDANDEKYEFGEADPQYIKDSALFEVRQTLAKEREEAGRVDQEAAAKAEVVGKLNDGMANVEKAGTEKYEDFADKIAEAVDARGGEPIHPLIGIGIAVSPAGADIAYRLATDEATSDKIEKLAQTNPNAAAIAFGELEGEYMEDDDSDLNPADPLDLARMLGRERARRKGGGVKKVDPATKVTKAPKPPEGRARGGSGQFEVSDDTDDFAAFEAKVMRGSK